MLIDGVQSGLVMLMGRASYKVKGGKLIKVQLIEREGVIEDVRIMGDFFLHPEEVIEEVESSLIGQPLDEGVLAELIESLLRERDATLLGATPKDLAKCIVMAGGRNG